MRYVHVDRHTYANLIVSGRDDDIRIINFESFYTHAQCMRWSNESSGTNEARPSQRWERGKRNYFTFARDVSFTPNLRIDERAMNHLQRTVSLWRSRCSSERYTLDRVDQWQHDKIEEDDCWVAVQTSRRRRLDEYESINETSGWTVELDPITARISSFET